ncbi:hypothetical protein AIOL_001855 [Candidatus Rhodobacter oscarellae]|uniref:Uncharacterized protein n=1 Tax=Candidatus Rhodobacter oscarellae TaxID=1675527 RepID=A0A0J9GTQ4_9RHOB|nr:hypothetical protein AIOL_001855 [Candidatus Rhodobacter lobularis]
MGGQIVDAFIVPAPRQRITDEEREIVKGGSDVDQENGA